MSTGISKNRRAFLDMLAWSEIGERLLRNSDNGYNVLVGGSLFKGYADHPNILNKALKSTAAGRYQILHRYWVAYKKLLSLPDFSPASQDAVALQMCKEQGALADIDAGRFVVAVAKVANIWASLPGAGYGQRENKISDLKVAYLKAGGTVA